MSIHYRMRLMFHWRCKDLITNLATSKQPLSLHNSADTAHASQSQRPSPRLLQAPTCSTPAAKRFKTAPPQPRRALESSPPCEANNTHNSHGSQTHPLYDRPSAAPSANTPRPTTSAAPARAAGARRRTERRRLHRAGCACRVCHICAAPRFPSARPANTQAQARRLR